MTFLVLHAIFIFYYIHYSCLHHIADVNWECALMLKTSMIFFYSNSKSKK